MGKFIVLLCVMFVIVRGCSVFYECGIRLKCDAVIRTDSLGIESDFLTQ